VNDGREAVLMGPCGIEAAESKTDISEGIAVHIRIPGQLTKDHSFQ
jgi:hypothetical protein